MTGFVTELRGEAHTNENFRKVLCTGLHCQLVVMSLKPGEEIGTEVHENDQFLYVEAGHGTAVLDEEEYPLDAGTGVMVPAGTEHNIINSGNVAMKLFTVYAPAEHDDGAIHPTKADAEKAEG